ncbi:carbohydrate ABC transporter permease (plasmid) [Parasedimentitalea marina]|uniref:Carbohydrate ABC transporter permease n=1 Tax=Parasedimentitalea marina TaxID=2483033 RepID=A0A3T0N9W7_9RHOB|nr:carbohydrate ABC transporter permease [Parasedimentitalea marina]AZV80844.1 carbohydrate ABC transporter permease [Parasedimentitalea marina]
MGIRQIFTLRALTTYALTAIFLVPIAWMISTSVRPPLDYISTSTSLIPSSVTLEHYRDLLQDDLMGKAINSVIVALSTTILALAAAFPAAYALVRLKFPARLDLVFLVFVLLVKLTPPISLAIPLHQVLRTLGLLDTLAGLILVYQVYALPFAIWMLLGFVRDVPVEYEEAALVDGATLQRRLWSIVLPVMAPGLIATSVFVVILSWNEFAYALLFIQSPSKFTLPTYIATLVTEDETFWGQLSAVGFMASLPILVMVSFVQKGLTQGFSGGIK